MRLVQLVTLLTAAASAWAQGSGSIDSAARNQTLQTLLTTLNQRYVYPETAAKMDQHIRERMKQGAYDSITGGAEFANQLTADLQSVSHDKHLRVTYSANPIPVRADGAGPTPEEERRQLRFMQAMNFGFEKIERLPGNIGYLDLRGFAPPEAAGDTATAAMNFLANTEALIVDLRQNGGGDPGMVALLSTYLFDGEVRHLNSLYWRPADFTHQWWTLPYVAGKRYGGNKPVFVLTSRRTFSAAEEFTNNLKELKRATIIGETTGGGAHPGGFERLSEHFGAFIPSGRAINPISKKNWEGTGVEPDVKVNSELALKTAHLQAIETLQKTEKDERVKSQLEGMAGRLRKELEAQTAK